LRLCVKNIRARIFDWGELHEAVVVQLRFCWQ
jgi:hypothetical protein